MLTFKLVCSHLGMIKKDVLSNLVLVMDIGASSYQCRNKVIITLALVGIWQEILWLSLLVASKYHI